MKSLYLLWMGITFALPATGCTSLRDLSYRDVTCAPPQVVAWVPLSPYVHKTVGISRFSVPSHLAGVAEWLTQIYVDELMQGGPFRSLRPLDAVVASAGEAIRLGRSERCDLILAPSLDVMVESSGAMPTELRVSVQLFDTLAARQLICIRQKAASEPGRDVDLVWNIIDGQPALRSRRLAEMLASQHAGFLASAVASPPVPGGK